MTNAVAVTVFLVSIEVIAAAAEAEGFTVVPEFILLAARQAPPSAGPLR